MDSVQETMAQEWKQCREVFLSKIAAIDARTPASESHPEIEPQWWLQMMACADFVRKQA